MKLPCSPGGKTGQKGFVYRTHNSSVGTLSTKGCRNFITGKRLCSLTTDYADTVFPQLNWHSGVVSVQIPRTLKL